MHALICAVALPTAILFKHPKEVMTLSAILRISDLMILSREQVPGSCRDQI
jgi:hypothetical protein